MAEPQINGMGGMEVVRKLRRSRQHRMISGVCGGVAGYFDVDVTLIRLLWLAFILLEGAGIILYIAAWVIIPEAGKDEEDA